MVYADNDYIDSIYSRYIDMYIFAPPVVCLLSVLNKTLLLKSITTCSSVLLPASNQLALELTEI